MSSSQSTQPFCDCNGEHLAQIALDTIASVAGNFDEETSDIRATMVTEDDHDQALADVGRRADEAKDIADEAKRDGQSLRGTVEWLQAQASEFVMDSQVDTLAQSFEAAVIAVPELQASVAALEASALTGRLTE